MRNRATQLEYAKILGVQWEETRMSYPHLFSPFRIGGLDLPNRIVMAPMSSALAGRDGRVSDRQIAYFRERARGGTGMIIVEFTCVDRRFGVSEPNQLVLEDESALDGHRRLVEAVNAEGTIASIQLQLPGQYALPHLNGGRMPAAPSVVHSRRSGAQMARAFEPQEIEELIEHFGRAAGLARRAGYQAIELHGAHGYLLMAFMSPLMNFRDDAWGGDAQRRLAFPLAAIRAVKAAAPDQPLIYRLSADDFMAEGLSIDVMEQIAPQLADAGVDALHASTGTQAGSMETIIDPMSFGEGWRLPLARRLRNAAGVPVITVGFRSPDVAERAIATGETDLVSLGRAMLADPYWAAKARDGRPEDIRLCTSCNWCMDRVYAHEPVACAENPRTGREDVPALPPDAGAGKRIVVVGGGPGGMAAALQAVEHGFAVTLFEKADVLGGGLIASAAPPHKDKLLWYRDYLAGRLSRSSVEVRTGEAAEAGAIVALSPDLVMLATGARTRTMDFPGSNNPRVIQAYDLLAVPEPDLPQGPVVVYGGGETGCETAELLTAAGVDTVLVSRSPETSLARAAEPIYRKLLLKRLRSNPRLRILCETSLTTFDGNAVSVKSGDGDITIKAATVVLAQGRDIGDPLEAELAERGVRTVVIGDAREIGRIGDAVHQASDSLAALCGTQDLPVPA